MEAIDVRTGLDVIVTDYEGHVFGGVVESPASATEWWVRCDRGHLEGPFSPDMLDYAY